MKSPSKVTLPCTVFLPGYALILSLIIYFVVHILPAPTLGYQNIMIEFLDVKIVLSYPFLRRVFGLFWDV